MCVTALESAALTGRRALPSISGPHPTSIPDTHLCRMATSQPLISVTDGLDAASATPLMYTKQRGGKIVGRALRRPRAHQSIRRRPGNSGGSSLGSRSASALSSSGILFSTQLAASDSSTRSRWVYIPLAEH